MERRTIIIQTGNKTELVGKRGAFTGIISQCLRTATVMADTDHLPANIKQFMGMIFYLEDFTWHQFDAVTATAAGLFLVVQCFLPVF
ncbi:hypothetical protein Xedl_03956 [Xenorhabdus eapokensis]|uniref:Uncharacterized protein n=1 Tax=Xenorhabdus eapokensis TaxID=1873482 RepID=A0A1Q5T3W3_9GAMM|nr:hypothetical protein Xedl_03956 [Xenorhabdus eapokensis]